MNCVSHLRMAVVLPVTFVLSGCLATLSNGPDKIYSDEEQIAQLRASLPPPDFTGPCIKSDRNNMITARMYGIDLQYTIYFTNLTKERQQGTLASDAALLGLGAATTVFGGAATKVALGAATTVVAGARSDIDKDVLLAQTVQILQNQMEVSRDAVKKRINANMALECPAYTLAEGLSDVQDYYRAGTLAGALESVSATVGNNAQEQKTLKNGLTPSGNAAMAKVTGLTGQGGQVKGR